MNIVGLSIAFATEKNEVKHVYVEQDRIEWGSCIQGALSMLIPLYLGFRCVQPYFNWFKKDCLDTRRELPTAQVYMLFASAIGYAVQGFYYAQIFANNEIWENRVDENSYAQADMRSEIDTQAKFAAVKSVQGYSCVGCVVVMNLIWYCNLKRLSTWEKL